MEYNKLIITVDGTAASGKGTLAAKLAEKYSFEHLDTGIYYRAAAFKMMNEKVDFGNKEEIIESIKSIDNLDVSESFLLSEEVGSCASKIAVIQEVRDSLNYFFRCYVNIKGSVVVDGRDIGTVVFPKAQIKLYVTATPEVRAERRFKQLQNSGKSIIYDDILEDLKVRDERDSNRKVAPLRPASDAIYIDTSNLDASSVLDLAISLTSALVSKAA